MKRDLLLPDYNERGRDRGKERVLGWRKRRVVSGSRPGQEGEKKKESKREPGVTSMADARSRGNISLTDVDKHCGRARSQGPNVHGIVRRAIERNRARNPGEEGDESWRDKKYGAYCFFQVSSRNNRPLSPKLRMEIRNDGHIRGG